MSGFERQLRRRQRVHPQLIAYDPERVTEDEAVLAAARASGCTCSPDLRATDGRTLVYHDHWCGLLRGLEDVN